MRTRVAAFSCLVQLFVATTAGASSSVTTTPSAGATDLTLDGEGTSSTHIIKVADLSLWTDSSAGFTVNVTSGVLSKSGGTSVPFKVALVADGAATPGAGAFTVPSGMTLSFSSFVPGAVEKDLYIMYTPAALQDPGPYAATIDVDIVDR